MTVGPTGTSPVAGTKASTKIQVADNANDHEVTDTLGEWDFVTTSNGGTQNNGSGIDAGDALEEMNSGNDESGDEVCTLCLGKLSSPRILNCLHVFCESCIDKVLIDEAGDSKIGSILDCSLCGQETVVGPKGASSLPCDYVLTNILDMSAIENMAVLCTSCKAKESAVARCSDCANFLCPNCNTAHQFMRCFESHKVIAFEDLKKSNEAIPIHKPIFCDSHPAENMKFYCYTCQVGPSDEFLHGNFE